MRILVLLLLAATALAGCSGSDGPETDTDPNPAPETGAENPAIDLPAVTIDVQLDGAYPATIAYSPSMMTAQAGQEVTIRFTNSDGNPLVSHDWFLEGVDGAATEVISNGEMSEVTFIAPAAGDYVFYCSVPGHRGNGMEGVFTVTA